MFEVYEMVEDGICWVVHTILINYGVYIYIYNQGFFFFFDTEQKTRKQPKNTKSKAS
jgi:hypothetical protein